jgi:hypothetical protein
MVTNGFNQHEHDLPIAAQVVLDEGVHHESAALRSQVTRIKIKSVAEQMNLRG